MRQSFSFYLGDRGENGFAGYIAEENLYLILESEEGLTAESGEKALQEIAIFLRARGITDLNTFDETLVEVFTQARLPIRASMAALYVYDSVLYLKTMGKGIIHLVRGKEDARLISGDAIASGYAQINDLFIVSTETFWVADEVEKAIKSHRGRPTEAVRTITERALSKKIPTAASIFLSFLSPEMNVPLAPETVVSRHRFIDALKDHVSRPYKTLRERTEAAGKKKIMTLAIVFILVLILIWSVGLASKRRKQESAQDSIRQVSDRINAKLSQADEVAFLNLPSALALIADSKTDLNTLEMTLGSNSAYKNELSQIKSKIDQEENKITKKEDKQYTEFFDFAVDTKDAKGVALYRNGENLAVLDKAHGVFYILSLEEKSLDKEKSSDFTKASLIALSGDTHLGYVVGQGIFDVQSGSAKKVIANDPDWGTIVSMVVYNGNIYLLDSQKGTIYKYVPVESGYSSKQTYFASEMPFLSGANSMAIDSSVYIASDGQIEKFTGGQTDSFATTFPNSGITIEKVITDKDLDNLYVWDKVNGAIYVLGKDGTYQREIQSSIFKTGSDVTVYKDSIYILKDSQLYTVGL